MSISGPHEQFRKRLPYRSLERVTPRGVVLISMSSACPHALAFSFRLPPFGLGRPEPLGLYPMTANLAFLGASLHITIPTLTLCTGSCFFESPSPPIWRACKNRLFAPKDDARTFPPTWYSHPSSRRSRQDRSATFPDAEVLGFPPMKPAPCDVVMMASVKAALAKSKASRAFTIFLSAIIDHLSRSHRT
jgi:hypothetical protein